MAKGKIQVGYNFYACDANGDCVQSFSVEWCEDTEKWAVWDTTGSNMIISRHPTLNEAIREAKRQCQPFL